MEQSILKEYDNDSIVLSRLYPNLETLFNNIVNTFNIINNLCNNRIGCKIFKADSKTLNDPRSDLDRIDKDIRDENTFILILLKIGTLIDDIYYDEIRKSIKVDQTGSINLIKELFDSNNIKYPESAIKDLRKLHGLRNTKHPIHQGEAKAISILEEFGVEYPTFDWAKATEIC